MAPTFTVRAILIEAETTIHAVEVGHVQRRVMGFCRDGVWSFSATGANGSRVGSFEAAVAHAVRSCAAVAS